MNKHQESDLLTANTGEHYDEIQENNVANLYCAFQHDNICCIKRNKQNYTPYQKVEENKSIHVSRYFSLDPLNTSLVFNYTLDGGYLLGLLERCFSFCINISFTGLKDSQSPNKKRLHWVFTLKFRSYKKKLIFKLIIFPG